MLRPEAIVPLSHKLILAHVCAVIGAAFSLTVLIPYPLLWSHLPGAIENFKLAMIYAGPLHILLGAAAMVAVGRKAIGTEATLKFLVTAVVVSSSFELLGTGTGWPFGAYHYTSGLGFKLHDQVPFSIPFSWFYASFSGWLLAQATLARVGVPSGGFRGVLLGVWLLTAWDLVLDPAMSHPDLTMRFWIWDKPGQYLGMPLINLAGWMACGLLIITIGRAWGGGDVDPERIPAREAFAVYGINLLFGAIICAVNGFWMPILLSTLVGALPAAIGLFGERSETAASSSPVG
jgi:putative membrane protein